MKTTNDCANLLFHTLLDAAASQRIADSSDKVREREVVMHEVVGWVLDAWVPIAQAIYDVERTPSPVVRRPRRTRRSALRKPRPRHLRLVYSAK